MFQTRNSSSSSSFVASCPTRSLFCILSHVWILATTFSLLQSSVQSSSNTPSGDLLIHGEDDYDNSEHGFDSRAQGLIRALADVQHPIAECNSGTVNYEENPENVTLALWNVWNYDSGGDWLHRSRIIYDQIRRVSPTIVALNELRVSSQKGNMFLEVCAALINYKGYFQPAMRYEDGTVEGIALFTKVRFQHVRSKHLHLKTHQVEDANRRAILGAYSPSLQTAFFVSHFSYEYEQRVTNAVGASWFMSWYKSPRKVILADFNAETERDPAVRLLKFRHKMADVHKTLAEPTYCNCGHSDCELNRRPDRILVSSPLLQKYRKTRAWTGPKGPMNGICASDHRAVFLQFEEARMPRQRPPDLLESFVTQSLYGV